MVLKGDHGKGERRCWPGNGLELLVVELGAVGMELWGLSVKRCFRNHGIVLVMVSYLVSLERKKEVCVSVGEEMASVELI